MKILRVLWLGVATALAVTAALATAPSAHAVGVVPAPLSSPAGVASMDETTRQALELQFMISGLKSEAVSIESRLKVLSDRITEQSTTLERAKQALVAAQSTYNEHAIAMYEFNDSDQLALLLDVRSLSDLVSRATILARVLEADQRVLDEAIVVEAQAEYQAGLLDELRTQDTALRGIQSQQSALAQDAIDEQTALETTLTARGRTLLEQRRTLEASTLRAWQNSTVPLDTSVPEVTATVAPYTDRTYLSTSFHPHRFATAGTTYSAVCSWYGEEFNGKPTASGQVFNARDFTCASRSLALGTWLALTRADKRIVVVVNDRGPYVDGQDLQLSRAAAQALDIADVDAVRVEVVVPTE